MWARFESADLTVAVTHIEFSGSSQKAQLQQCSEFLKACPSKPALGGGGAADARSSSLPPCPARPLAVCTLQLCHHRATFRARAVNDRRRTAVEQVGTS